MGQVLCRFGSYWGEQRSHTVDDAGAHDDVRRLELTDEILRLDDRVGARRSDENEGRVVRTQQLDHRLGPLGESLLHALEGAEEGDCVVDDLGPDDSRDLTDEDLRGAVDG